MASNGVWGIEIGQCALKAVKLRPAEDGRVELAAFDLIEHAKILSQPDAEPDELIKAAIEKFVSRNEWQKDPFVIGVPGQQTFARFCKLPPVEPKKIPDIVKFEAGQQIPFDINEVVWDYQVFQAKDSPDVEVGIFAMKNDLVRRQLDAFAALASAPTAIQTIPMALYNFCHFDAQTPIGDRQATVIVDVGAQNTDLIVVEASSAWTRNIPLGGNNFTDALVKAFKLSFAKAENLKRTAADSKYARQVFQAMRPVFADLVAEIQRSLGFYSSTHRDVEIKAVMASGNAFRLPGLQKYLENNLTIPEGVTRLEKFTKLVPSATANAPQFAENALAFGAAFGLALQGLGLAPISSNLLPPELARIAMWKRKRYYFAATAACLGMAAAFPWLRIMTDSNALADTSRIDQTKSIVSRANAFQQQFNEAQSDSAGKKEKVQSLFELGKDRALVPAIAALITEALPEPPPEIAAADSPERLKQLIQSNPQRYVRTNRGQIVIEHLRINFSKNIDADEPKDDAIAGAEYGGGGGGGGESTLGVPQFGGRGRTGFGEPPPPQPMADGSSGEAAAAPGFMVQLSCRVLQGERIGDTVDFVNATFIERLKKLGNTPGLGFYIPDEDPKSPDKRNFRRPQPNKFTAAETGANRPTGGRGAGRNPLIESTLTDPAAATGPKDADPVTGEDRSTDWRVSFSFKIKLGEAPPKADVPTDGSGQPAPAQP